MNANKTALQSQLAYTVTKTYKLPIFMFNIKGYSNQSTEAAKRENGHWLLLAVAGR